MPLYKGRAYTKSGSVERYESNLWIGIVETTQDPATPAYPSQTPYLVSAPDANGNYQISFRNTAPGVTFTAKTCYGPKVKEFSYCVELPDITSSQISFTGEYISVSNGNTPNSGDFILTVPVNCNVSVKRATNSTCRYGAVVSFITTTPTDSSKTTYNVRITGTYIPSMTGMTTTVVMCNRDAVNITVTANSDNTEYKPGSSVTLTEYVVEIM